MSFDGEEHETRRNVLLAAGLSVVAVVLVGGMFWMMSSLTRPAVSGTATGVKATSAAPTTSDAPAPTSTTTFVPPSPTGTWTATSTATLPPPEQPTVTAPVEVPTPAATTSAAAPPAPRTTAPPVTQTPPAPPSRVPAPPPTSAPATPATPATPAAPSVTNVNLRCSKDAGKRVSGQLSFTTTTRIDVLLGAGGSVQRQQAGPGNVTLTASGRGAEICFAQVAGQTVGPIQAG